MRKLVRVLVPAALLLSTVVPAAAQEVVPPSQPSQGEHSAGRNPHGTGFGPHCHVVVAASAHAPFPFISVMPSHTAHLATNAAQGGSAVFQADPNCDGDPGQ